MLSTNFWLKKLNSKCASYRR